MSERPSLREQPSYLEKILSPYIQRRDEAQRIGAERVSAFAKGWLDFFTYLVLVAGIHVVAKKSASPWLWGVAILAYCAVLLYVGAGVQKWHIQLSRKP